MGKSYPAWHYFVAAALALAIGLTYTLSMFQPLLGPGMLLVAAAFAFVGFRKRISERAAPPIPPAAEVTPRP